MTWRKLELRECASFASGGTPNKGRAAYWGGEIPWVSSGEMTRQFLDDTSLRITEEGAEAGSRVVPAGTIFTVVRGMSLAKEFRISFAKRTMAFNQDLKALTAKNGIDSYFLFCSLRAHADQIRDLATEAAHGTKKLEMERLASFRINVPDFDTQKRAADCVRNYDDLIETNRRRIALLEESARLLYREWFVKLRFPGHESVKVTDGVPEGWSKKSLDDVAYIVMGQSPESKYYNTDKNGLPFHQGVSDFGDRFVSHSTFTSQTTRIAEAGDILCSVRAPVGRLNVTSDKIAIGRGLSAMRSKENMQSLLFYQLKGLFLEEDMIGSGAIFASVCKKELFAQQLLQPDSAIAIQFNRITSVIDDQIKTLIMQNRGLAEARDALLPKLMSGQLAV